MRATATIIGVFIAIAVGIGFWSISLQNSAKKAEQGIHASYENLEQQFGQLGQQIAEQIGVANMQEGALTRLLQTTMEGRYGDEGAQAQILLIQEAMPNLDTAAYTNIQRIIEAGRNDFVFAQKLLIDRKATYRSKLDSVVGGSLLQMLDYPRINIGFPLGDPTAVDDYPAITTAAAVATFEAGVEECDMVTRANNGGKCPDS